MPVTVKTYAELAEFVRNFAAGSYHLLVISGPPGTGKTYMVNQVMRGKPCLMISGKISAFRLYKELWLHRDEDAVIDEIEMQLNDLDIVHLLKSLCESREEKRLSWDTEIVSRSVVPAEFTTRSRALLIGLDWKAVDTNLGALESRGRVVLFEPSPDEVHNLVKGIFKDSEVLDYIEPFLKTIPHVSIRQYLNALFDKAGGLNWQRTFLEDLGIKEEFQLVARLQGDARYATERDKVRAFIEQTGKSQPTYYRIKKQFGDKSGSKTK